MVSLKDMKIKKKLQIGGKSMYVYLMKSPDGQLLIKKAYNPSDKAQLKRYKSEVKIMKHLEHCPFVPKLVFSRDDKCVIWMTYVGSPLKNIPKDKNDLADQMKQLHLEWNVMRHRNGVPNYSVFIGNGTRLNGTVYVIDFGSYHYKIVGPKKMEKIVQ